MNNKIKTFSAVLTLALLGNAFAMEKPEEKWGDSSKQRTTMRISPGFRLLIGAENWRGRSVYGDLLAQRSRGEFALYSSPFTNEEWSWFSPNEKYKYLEDGTLPEWKKDLNRFELTSQDQDKDKERNDNTTTSDRDASLQLSILPQKSQRTPRQNFQVLFVVSLSNSKKKR